MRASRLLTIPGGPRIAAAAWLLALGFGPAPFLESRAAEPELLSDQADGLLELQGETELELTGAVGTFALRLGKPGELRFATRLRENRRESIPSELWIDGSRLILTAPESSAETPRLIEITVPPDLTVRVDTASSVVRANGLRGDLEVVGDDLDIDARGIIGNVFLDLLGGKAVLVGIDQALEIVLEGTDLKIDQATGPLVLQQRKGRTEILQLLGDIDMDIDEVTLTGNHVEGVLEMRAARSSVDWVQIRGGATMQLSESPLILAETQGVMEIDTDQSVEFRSVRGPMTVRGYGAAVRGSGATSMVEVDTSDAEVKLSSMSGPIVLRGRGLDVSISQSKNSIKLETESSTVVLDDCGGTVDVRNDFGDLKVLNAAQKVRIDSTEGIVEVRDLRAPIELKADGPEVSVGWAELIGDQDSSIENPGGTVSLTIPQGAGGCTVDAVSDYGAVESRIPGVELDGNSNQANVVIRAPKPKVKVRAGGDVSLALGSAAARQGGGNAAGQTRR